MTRSPVLRLVVTGRPGSLYLSCVLRSQILTGSAAGSVEVDEEGRPPAPLPLALRGQGLARRREIADPGGPLLELEDLPRLGRERRVEGQVTGRGRGPSFFGSPSSRASVQMSVAGLCVIQLMLRGPVGTPLMGTPSSGGRSARTLTRPPSMSQISIEWANPSAGRE